MRSAEEQAAWKASFLAAMKPTHDSIAGLRRRGETFAEPAIRPVPAPVSPPPAPSPSPIVAAPPTAAELEFERVRAAGCARIDAGRIARRAQEAAVTMILDAYATFEPTGRTILHLPQRGSVAGEDAAALILSFIPKQRS